MPFGARRLCWLSTLILIALGVAVNAVRVAAGSSGTGLIRNRTILVLVALGVTILAVWIAAWFAGAGLLRTRTILVLVAFRVAILAVRVAAWFSGARLIGFRTISVLVTQWLAVRAIRVALAVLRAKAIWVLNTSFYSLLNAIEHPDYQAQWLLEWLSHLGLSTGKFLGLDLKHEICLVKNF